MLLPNFLNATMHIFRFEFKANHGEWIYAVRPNLGPGIQERVSEVLTTKYENMECCYGIRAELQACLTGLLGVILLSIYIVSFLFFHTF